MADRHQRNRRNRERPYDRTDGGDQNRRIGGSDSRMIDTNRRLARRQIELNNERRAIEEEQNPDGKSRYEEYSLIAETLGRLTAEEYRLFEQNEAVPSTGNPMRIHATRQEIFANREANMNEFNTLASEFQEYLPFANRIRRFNSNVADHNIYCPESMRVEEIQDHLKLMNEAFNDEIGEPEVNPFTQNYWNVDPASPPTPPRRSDGHDSSDTSGSEGHNGSGTSSNDGYDSSDTSSSDIDID